MTPDLILKGAYDPGLVRFLERVLVAGNHAVDVGAGIGVFTIRMALLVGPKGGVLACEPDPTCQALLARNIELNSVSGWTRLEPVVAYSSETILTMHPAGESEVEARPLDDLIDPTWTRIVVLVDAGGAERHVLEGLRHAIAERSVRHIVMGFTPEAAGAEWERLNALLAALERDHGATFAAIAHDGTLRPRRPDDAEALDRYSRLVVSFEPR